jgi:hypothetical protein
MDSSSQPPVAALSTKLPVLVSSSAVAPVSFSASILPWPQPTDGGHALFNPNNTPLLQPSSVTAIVSLSHTYQVISLKLTNTNYLYWQMQMKPYLLGKGVMLRL